MKTKQHSLTVKKTINAPVDKVFEAWSNPNLMKKWFAPGEMTVPIAEVNFKVGGHYRIKMQESHDKSHTVFGVYKEIILNKKISFTWQWENDDVETLVSIELKAKEHYTELTLTHSRFEDEEQKDLHLEGWNGCIINLEKFLK